MIVCMELTEEKVAVVMDGKRYLCSLELIVVKGGKHVLYVADDGNVLKQEPLFRYNERMKRRASGSNVYEVKQCDADSVALVDILTSSEEQGVRLYHGSPDPNFVPSFGGGRDYHDYGNAFYCTLDFDSAAEWACLRKTVTTAYVYEYDFFVPKNVFPRLEVLDFDKLDSIYWLSVLLQHRVDEGYREEIRDRSTEFAMKYPANCDTADIIHGWRADDRYFAIIRDFLSTLISLETAKDAIMFGNLGKQFVVKSERAYSWIKHADAPVRKIELTGEEYKKWHGAFIEKDIGGRSDYDALVAGARKLAREQKNRGTTILDLLR